MDSNNQPEQSPSNEPVSAGPTSPAPVIDNVKPAGSAQDFRSTSQNPATNPNDKPQSDPSSGQPSTQATPKAQPVLPAKTPSHNSSAIVVILAIVVIILLLAVAVFAYIHSQGVSAATS